MLGHVQAIDVEIQHVAGVNPVRVVHLLVHVPDLWPQPRLLEEPRGDAPQRVALLDHVRVRVAGTQLRSPRIGGERDQQTRA